MVDDLASEVDRIATHLGIALPPEQRRQIARRFSLERQRERISAAISADCMRSAFGQKLDRHSNLHSNHIHSAETGAWREQLTRRQVALVEQLAGDWLTANGYVLGSRPLPRFWFMWEDRLRRKLRARMRPSRNPRPSQ
jgi:hypothetical protein